MTANDKEGLNFNKYNNTTIHKKIIYLQTPLIETTKNNLECHKCIKYNISATKRISMYIEYYKRHFEEKVKKQFLFYS